MGTVLSKSTCVESIQQLLYFASLSCLANDVLFIYSLSLSSSCSEPSEGLPVWAGRSGLLCAVASWIWPVGGTSSESEHGRRVRSGYLLLCPGLLQWMLHRQFPRCRNSPVFSNFCLPLYLNCRGSNSSSQQTTLRCCTIALWFL